MRNGIDSNFLLSLEPTYSKIEEVQKVRTLYPIDFHYRCFSVLLLEEFIACIRTKQCCVNRVRRFNLGRWQEWELRRFGDLELIQMSALHIFCFFVSIFLDGKTERWPADNLMVVFRRSSCFHVLFNCQLSLLMRPSWTCGCDRQP